MRKSEKRWTSLMKKLNLILSSLIFILFFTIETNSSSDFKKIIKGSAKIIDGDTIKVKGEKIRLFGIDAPEMKQICINKNSKLYKCGQEAKFALETYIYSQVICYYNSKDRYGRILGICFVEETELNKMMVQSGNAVAYLKYSKKYLNDQEIAKNKNRGLWSGEFDMPWEWRRKYK